VGHHSVDVGQPRLDHAVVLLPQELLPVHHHAGIVSGDRRNDALLVERLPCLLNFDNGQSVRT
jgi:hypothetical protein